MSEGINLLDPNKQGANTADAKRLQTMRFVAIGMLFIVSVSSVVLFMLVSLSPLPQLQQQEEELKVTLSQSGDDMAKLALLEERTTSIDALLKGRTSYEEILALLQSKLPSNAQITSIRLDQKTLVLTIESRSLNSLDSFLNGLISDVQNKKAFSQVTMTSLANDNIRNDYAMTVSLILL
jgi:Tfp pilus assembly protein PilN